MLAAVMLSMMVLTTALLLHAVAMHDQRAGVQPHSVVDRTEVDHSPQPVVMRGR